MKFFLLLRTLSSLLDRIFATKIRKRLWQQERLPVIGRKIRISTQSVSVILTSMAFILKQFQKEPILKNYCTGHKDILATLLIKLGFPIGTSKLLSSPILDMEVLHIIALLYNSAIDEF